MPTYQVDENGVQTRKKEIKTLVLRAHLFRNT